MMKYDNGSGIPPAFHAQLRLEEPTRRRRTSSRTCGSARRSPMCASPLRLEVAGQDLPIGSSIASMRARCLYLLLAWSNRSHLRSSSMWSSGRKRRKLGPMCAKLRLEVARDHALLSKSNRSSGLLPHGHSPRTTVPAAPVSVLVRGHRPHFLLQRAMKG